MFAVGEKSIESVGENPVGAKQVGKKFTKASWLAGVRFSSAMSRGQTGCSCRDFSLRISLHFHVHTHTQIYRTTQGDIHREFGDCNTI